MGLIASLCVAAGLAPRFIVGELQALLIPFLGPAAGLAASGAGTFASPFTAAKLAGSAIVVALGVVLYFGLRSAAGMRVTHRIERLAPQLRVVLLFFFAGLAGFSVVLAVA
jgi:hypothetical protein